MELISLEYDDGSVLVYEETDDVLSSDWGEKKLVKTMSIDEFTAQSIASGGGPVSPSYGAQGLHSGQGVMGTQPTFPTIGVQGVTGIQTVFAGGSGGGGGGYVGFSVGGGGGGGVMLQGTSVIPSGGVVNVMNSDGTSITMTKLEDGSFQALPSLEEVLDEEERLWGA